MRITSSTNTAISGASPKVVETSNGFLINTQYYTKERLSAVALEFLRTSGSPYALSIRKQLFLQTPGASAIMWRFPNDEVDIFKDSKYENRFYARVIGGYVEDTIVFSYLLTIEESEDKEFRCLYITPFSGFTITGIVDQDDNFLYLTTRSTGGAAIYTMNKTTFALSSKVTMTSTRNYVNLTKIYNNDTDIYFMYYADQSIYTLIFNKSTQTHTVTTAIYRGKEETPGSGTLTVLNDSPYHIDDNTSGLFLFNYADPVQPIDLYCYDRSKSSDIAFDMKPVNIIWNDAKSQIDFTTTSIQNTIRMFISEFDDAKYLNLVSYQANFTGATYASIQGVYTFRIDSDIQLTFTGFEPLDRAKLIGGFIYDESKEHLIVSKQNAFQIFKFNKTKLVYEATSLEIPSCYSVGLDELQRIWYIKTDSSTHMINMEDAQSVDIRFEKQYYDFTGTGIDTYITFSALNYLGELFKGKFELTISGPAVFTDDGSNILTFDYDGETKQIGLTILGASPVTIYPKFIKTI